MTEQDLPLRIDDAKVKESEIAWMLKILSDGNWHTAISICRDKSFAPTDSNRRYIRALADASSGRIAGGQKGYKLVSRMDIDEYQHSRNFLLSQAKEMQRRVMEMDRVFYARKAVPK